MQPVFMTLWFALIVIGSIIGVDIAEPYKYMTGFITGSISTVVFMIAKNR